LKNDRIIFTLWHIDFVQYAFSKEIETDKADYNCISTTASEAAFLRVWVFVFPAPSLLDGSADRVDFYE
jgi:hypothetical protein